MNTDNKKINILEMHSCLGYTGGERNMVSFCKFLNKNLFNVYVASYIRGGVQEKRLQALGIEYLVGNGDASRVINFIKEKEIDVLHIHRSGGQIKIETEIIKKAKKINHDLVVIEKNVFGKYDPSLEGKIDLSIFQSMMHLNERYLPAFGKNFDFDKMKVFYNMVDLDSFSEHQLNTDDIAKAREKLCIGQQDFVIGKIARPHIAKWSDLILDMVLYLVKQVPNIKFVIIGLPKSREKKVLTSKYKDKFIILPETNNEKDVHKFYQIIDVLAHASKIGECNGNTINEAMYWQKPVVVNSTPHRDNGQLEQVIHMKNGLIANYPQTFARAIAHLYKNSDLRLEMGKQGHRDVLKKNSPESIVKYLEKSIFSILASKNNKDFSSSLDFYKEIKILPTESDIIAYQKNYQSRLVQEFGDLSQKEKFENLLRSPQKFFNKLKDFIIDKINI